MKKRLAPWLVAFAAALGLPFAAPAAAVAASIDPQRPCSLTVHKHLVGEDHTTSGVPDEGAVLELGYVPGIDLSTPEGWRTAEVLADTDPAAIATEPVARGVTDARGEVTFRNLDVGLYTVKEIEPDDDAVTPFVVMLPMADPEDGDRLLYDLVANPKVTPANQDPPTEHEPVYDLALRTWISEVWRDGTRVFERQSPVTDAGPEFVVPHVTFDDPTVDIQVGDLVVHDIHLFNQGNRTARVDELVNHSADGLDYAGATLMDTIPGHDNAGWELASDGLWHLPMEDSGIVLAPGEDFEVHLTLQVLPDALGPGVDVADHYTFVEISKFSGWVPNAAEPAQAITVDDAGTVAVPASGVMATSLAAQPLLAATYDGTPGSWAQVADYDSTPARSNVAVDGDRLVYHSWEDNEITESNTSMSWDDGSHDYDNDEDDHDGAIIRVVRSEAPAGAPGIVAGLARTGAEIGVIVAVAAALLAVGTGAVVTGARRSARRRPHDAVN